MCQQMNQFTTPVMPELYDNISSIMHTYLAQHSKVFIVRADIRYPQDYPLVPDNFHIQRCMAKTIQYFRRNGYNPMYIWVREQKTAFHPHYHCLFFLNGHKTRSAGMVFDTLSRFWASTIGSNAPGLIHYCEQVVENSSFPYGQLILRSRGIPENVYGMMDYLAKDDGKGEPNDGLRNFGMSRLNNRTMINPHQQEEK